MIKEVITEKQKRKDAKLLEEFRKFPPVHPQKFPLEAYDWDTLPYKITIKNGETKEVYPHALGMTRKWGEKIWKEATDKLTREERKDCQIVVIPPKHEQIGNGDFTKNLLKDLKTNQIGKYPVAILNRTRYEKIEYGKNIEGQRKVKSVYIVVSAVTEDDLSDIRAVAQEYREAGAIEINLVMPFIKDEREDKNISKSTKNKKGVYNGRIIKIKNVMEDLSNFIDRIVTFEPHSAATHTFAALNDIALAPLSLEEELIGEIKDKIWANPKKWVVVRPDDGRNLVATRIEKIYGILGVHLEKLRNSLTRNSETNDLKEKEKKSLKGKNTILYDDEGGTLGTIKDIVMKKFIPAGVASINIFLVHARLQKKWRKNLDEIVREAKKNNIPINIYFSDSRRPLGNLKSALRDYKNIIKIVSVKDKVEKVIQSCIGGVNFWVENSQEGQDWEREILMPIPRFDEVNDQERHKSSLTYYLFTKLLHSIETALNMFHTGGET